MMPLARGILGTVAGIPAALAETEIKDLYEAECVLQAARNSILEIALRRLSCAEGDRLALEHRRRALSAMQEGGSPE